MLMSRALANPDLISLAAGFVDQETLPADETRQALQSLFADPAAARAALQYGTTPGYPPLRQRLLDQALEGHPASCSRRAPTIDQVVLTAGSNQLLHLVLESIADAGDIILCAAPTYLVVLGTIANLGVRSVGVATDDQGMIPESLEATLTHLAATEELARVRAIYLVTYFDNPRGITMPLKRLAQVVEIAHRWSRGTKIYVIADEAYRDLRYRGDDVPSALTLDEDGDTVVVAGTFSKSYSPGVRVGWGILPAAIVGPVCSQKGNIDFGSPNFCQHLMHRVLDQGLFTAHVERMCAGYREKLHAMLQAMEEELAGFPGADWRSPDGGLYVWLGLPASIDSGPAGTLFDKAIEEGVLYVPGQYCYPSEGEPTKSNALRLSFGVQSAERIREGIAALARALQAQ
jgi:2-aminoadipate transaminase